MTEEQIDVLNPDGTFAGYSRGRTEVHEKGLWHRTVHIWAFDKSGRILFQLRAAVKENNPGLLDTSCAGHISAGDSSCNAAVRELREELGVTKTAEELEYLFESGHESVLNGGSYLDNEYYDTYKIVLSDEEAASLVPQPGEVDDFVWMTREEFFAKHKLNPEKFVDHPKDYAWLESNLVL
ncbi:Isopentenyldiphosphate isomerase [Fibrobacter sp. UWH5]|uniref:NUDIX hydrolase n=1 Tax=Fibrobacter sp. UWH5 TaxID=1896211 RepID=UPI00090EDCBE|nr:NUDIX domain-containing protein [Fibrobacter sp. UWH5]SHL64282.1 Isopentenyldiphosphate isomerase [Fibrobacter sp. UWH5]